MLLFPISSAWIEIWLCCGCKLSDQKLLLLEILSGWILLLFTFVSIPVISVILAKIIYN